MEYFEEPEKFFLKNWRFKQVETQFKEVFVQNYLNKEPKLFQKFGLQNFNQNVRVFYVDNLSEFGKNTKIQEEIEQNPKIKLGIVSSTQIDDYYDFEMFYIEPKLKKINKKYQIHGKNIKMYSQRFYGESAIWLLNFKNSKPVGPSEYSWLSHNNRV